MASVFHANTRCGLSWVLCVMICCIVLTLDGATAANNTSPEVAAGSCIRSMTVNASERVPLPQDFLKLPESSSFSFNVTPCSDVGIILSAVNVTGEPRADVIKFVISQNGDDDVTMTPSVSGETEVGPIKESLLPANFCSVSDFRSFSIDWDNSGMTMTQFREPNKTITNDTWEAVLLYELPGNFHVYNIFLEYMAELKENESSVSSSEWKIAGECQEQPFDYSSMVTRGHLAGSVVAALLCGILLGVFCIQYGPKIIQYIRNEIAPRLRRKKTDKATTEGEPEELATLVGVQTSASATDKPPGPTRADNLDALPPEPAALPGDNLPPPNPQTPRKASNAYTPYHQMGGTAAPSGSKAKSDVTKAKSGVTKAKRDVTKPAKSDVTKPAKSDVRKASVGGRTASSPLPALPGDVTKETASGEEASEPEECYINADAHVYEGVRHDTPIYENRNTGEYEVLTPKK